VVPTVREEVRVTSFSILPQVQYILTDTLTLGLDVTDLIILDESRAMTDNVDQDTNFKHGMKFSIISNDMPELDENEISAACPDLYHESSSDDEDSEQKQDEDDEYIPSPPEYDTIRERVQAEAAYKK
jgi:hypothetical protein